jgi:hypothetical protein
MPKMIDAAVKEQALRMFAHHRRHHPSATALATATATATARRVGVRRETARRRLAHGGGMATVAVLSRDDLDTGSAHALWPTAGRHRR